ncbi:MAG: tetratricopeptide repeat protein [Verrucomicrobiota bacterium]
MRFRDRRLRTPTPRTFGPDHPNVAIRLNNLAQLLKATNRMDQAEEPMQRALAILVRSLGAEHPNSKTVARNFIGLLQELGRDEAEIVEEIRQLLDQG